jgi:hypothetical protein
MFGRKNKMQELPGVDVFRGAAMLSFMDDRGWDAGPAGRAALAMHPLDDYPEPSRAFEDLVRARSTEVAAFMGLSPDPVRADVAVTAALMYYRELAQRMGESHYMTRGRWALIGPSAALHHNCAPSI